LLSTFAIGGSVRLFGGVPPAGIVLGLCLALSSTAIVMQLLIEQHRAANQVGRIALSVLLFQDLMVVPILFVVGILAGREGADGAGILSLIRPFAEALSAVIAIMLVGRYVVRPLLRSAVRTGSRDLIMAITLLILVVFSLATGLAGLSVALGAFLAGLLLSDSEVRHNIEVDLEPFKGLLLGIFFITVGTRVDVGVLAADIGWIVLAVVALMGVKAAILYVVARLFRVPRPDAAEVALLLAQAGEFGFVVIAVAGPLLPARLAAGAVAVVGLSMLATPVLAAAGRRLAARLAAAEHGEQAPGADLAELNNHVIIGGFGRVGRLVAQALEAENVPYVALDANGELVARMRLEHHPVFFGDAGRPELLERVGAARARAFVVTLNNPLAAERMVTAALNLQSKPMIFARAADPAHAMRLLDCGAVTVIPETVEAGLQLAARLLEGLDLPDEAVIERVAAMRAAELGRLVKGAKEDRESEPVAEESGGDGSGNKVS
jgi:CPA2 family monovalent cation:H+ antiporter-2